MFRTVASLALIAIGLLAVLLFHLGWQRRNPGVRPPASATLSFVGGFVFVLGAILGSWIIAVLGATAWLVARLLRGGGTTTDP